MGPPRLPSTPAIRGQPRLKTEPNRLFPGLVANFATCVDARFGARRIFWIGAARGQVLTCVRPLMRLTRRRPGWEFADQVQIRATRLERLSQSWFSRSRLRDRCAIPLLRPSHAPTAPQPRALRRARPELGKSHPWPSRPRPCEPSCWPRPPAPASAACKPACGRSRSRPEHHGGPPNAGRRSRR